MASNDDPIDVTDELSAAEENQVINEVSAVARFPLTVPGVQDLEEEVRQPRMTWP